jgi:hypothetical protein
VTVSGISANARATANFFMTISLKAICLLFSAGLLPDIYAGRPELPTRAHARR